MYLLAFLYCAVLTKIYSPHGVLHLLTMVCLFFILCRTMQCQMIICVTLLQSRRAKLTEWPELSGYFRDSPTGIQGRLEDGVDYTMQHNLPGNQDYKIIFNACSDVCDDHKPSLTLYIGQSPQCKQRSITPA